MIYLCPNRGEIIEANVRHHYINSLYIQIYTISDAIRTSKHLFSFLSKACKITATDMFIVYPSQLRLKEARITFGFSIITFSSIHLFN